MFEGLGMMVWQQSFPRACAALLDPIDEERGEGLEDWLNP